MERVCKTIHQYNKEPIKEADMQKLLEIAGDYRKVKNYVYSRYGGIASLSKRSEERRVGKECRL